MYLSISMTEPQGKKETVRDEKEKKGDNGSLIPIPATASCEPDGNQLPGTAFIPINDAHTKQFLKYHID